MEIGHTQRRHWSIRPVRPQREIIFAGRFRGVTARVECDQGLLHIRRHSRRLRQQRRGALEIFQRRLGERLTSRFEIKLGETFARIPEAFRRIFLHQTGRERHAFTGRFEERIELPQRDRALLAGPEIERMVFANTRVALALASLARCALVELLHAVIEGMNFFGACKLRAGWRRPGPLVPAGKNQVRPFLILRACHCEQLHARIRMVACG